MPTLPTLFFFIYYLKFYKSKEEIRRNVKRQDSLKNVVPFFVTCINVTWRRDFCVINVGNVGI